MENHRPPAPSCTTGAADAPAKGTDADRAVYVFKPGVLVVDARRRLPSRAAAREALDKFLVAEAMKRSKGSIAQAARLLGMRRWAAGNLYRSVKGLPGYGKAPKRATRELDDLLADTKDLKELAERDRGELDRLLEEARTLEVSEDRRPAEAESEGER